MSLVCIQGSVRRGGKKMSLVDFQAGEVNGDSPSSTDEVSPN